MNDPVAYWNGAAGDRWVSEQERLDAMLAGYGKAALDAARAAPGERVIDVGCGCGETSLALARLVAGEGRVVGVDLSAQMIARARERGAGLGQLSFALGDATVVALPGGPFDVLFSRFGVMFFPEPEKAFAHLRAALRPGGRLAFVCWRALEENPWAKLPFDAVAELFHHTDPPPFGPGPFSFADPARVQAILTAAGFSAVSHAPYEGTMVFGESGALSDAAADIARIGPAARLLVDRPEADVARAIEVIERVAAPFFRSGSGARFPGAAWVVTATTAA